MLIGVNRVTVALLSLALALEPPPVSPEPTADSIVEVEGMKKGASKAGWKLSDFVPGVAEPLKEIAKAVASNLSEEVPDLDFSKVFTVSAPPPVCTWQPVDPATEPHAIPIPYDLASGRLEKKVCGAPEGDTTGMGAAVVDWNFVPNDDAPEAAAVAPVVDVQALAQQAYEELQVPTPIINVGPDRSTVAVQLPTWLWVDDPGPLTATVATAGVTVTANATLVSTDWTLGEPPRNPDFTGYRAGPAVTMTCSGAGTPPPADVDWKAEPPCGHTFRWRSLPERTGGTGAWPISVTTNWDVTWTATTGQTGQIQLTSTGTDALPVTEYRILLTAGG